LNRSNASPKFFEESAGCHKTGPFILPKKRMDFRAESCQTVSFDLFFSEHIFEADPGRKDPASVAATEVDKENAGSQETGF
jgi:hypothetical protein